MEEITSQASIYLDIQMIADTFNELGWDFTLFTGACPLCLRGCQLYCGQKALRTDTLYLIPREEQAPFPTDTHCYVSIGDVPGKAPHIRSVQMPMTRVLNVLLDTFRRYLDFESALNHVLSSQGTLTELCRVGSDFFHNPMYVHDDLFTVVALSSRVEGMLEFEYNENTGKLYIPLWLINEFKFDSPYRQTMELHKAGVWGTDQYPYNIRSLFVNLWDGTVFKGRLLINELSSSLQPGQFRTAEYFSRFVLMLLRQGTEDGNLFHSFEDTFVKLVTGTPVDHRDLRTMLSILGWEASDRYLCLQMQNQSANIPIHADSALISKLPKAVRGYASFRFRQKLYLVVNLHRTGADPTTLRGSLAPYVRDGCMYGGISNPVEGIYEIKAGFRQAEIILDYIITRDNSQWLLPFSACAMAYIQDCATREIPTRVLVEPALLQLLAFDRENATQYYKTLRAYLYHERSISATAEALVIHRTTLTYRLGKIGEIVKLNLDDPNQRQYLMLSLLLLEQDEEAKKDAT